MMKKLRRYSGQRFRYDINLIIKILDILSNSNNEKIIDNKNLSHILRIGVPKVQTFKNYCEISDLIMDRKLTSFGQYILKFRDNPDIYQPLLFYKLCRGWDNGGHFYYSKIVNNVLYDRYFSVDNVIDNSEIREKIMDYKNEYDKIDVKLVSLVTAAISSEEGFSHLGMLTRQNRSRFSINYYKPRVLVAAYIIYDSWPENQTTISFEDIIRDEYSLGRIFFLTEEDVISILSKLHQDEYIKIEDKAGLRQVAKNSNISTDDILEEIYNAYFSNTFSS